MPQTEKYDDLYVVIISTLEERNQLHDLCVKYNIPVLYPELFKQKKIQNLWGVSKTGIGLVGTVVARSTPKERVLHSLNELENVLKK